MIKTFEVIDKLVLDANESSTFTLLLKGENIDIEYHLSDGEYNILVFNDTNNLKLKESGYIKNGSLKITYLELNNSTFKQENKLEVYKDSVLTIDSVYLGVDTKDIVFDILNAESLSEVNISNNVVCLNDADFTLSIIGNIKKGSKYCKCHQKSRCLTFENPKKAKILPILNIDECDVEASHSLSSGTIDEDVLFYMNSRGLTFSEALLLLIHSYLMPDDEFYKQFENGDLIKEKASKKGGDNMLDVNAIRNDFPFIKNNPEVIYFDSAATSLKPQSVIDAVNDFYTKYTANIHRGDYDVSFKTSKAYDETRKIVKDFINAESFQEIVFTSGDTFSLNQIIFGYVKTHIKEDEYILTTKLEHASSILPVYECHKQFLFADVNSDGTINLSKFEELFKTNNKIKYVLITYVSNVLGYINPIKELCTLAHQHGVKVIVDGAQALPHFKVDVKDLDVDFLTFSGHKMLSGSGIGILYGKKELLEEMTPLLYGGGANARFDDKGNIILKNVPERFEAGTPNIEGVISLGAAIKYLDSIGMNNIHEYDASLVDYAMRKLSSLDNLIIYNPLSRSSLITFNVKGIFAQDVASYLNYHHICVRTGNHCAKILHNIIGEDQTIRLSLYFYNTKEEIDKIYEVLKDITIEKCIGVVI